MTDPENTNGDYPPLATTLEREKDQRLIETCTVIFFTTLSFNWLHKLIYTHVADSLMFHMTLNCDNLII